MSINFTHLHHHTDNSIMDGLTSSDKAATKAQELGFKALAITDHRNLTGAFTFVKCCKDKGIKPIIGVEVDIVNDRTIKEKQESCHMVMLAKNTNGYRKLLKIVNDANLNGYYYYPRTDINFIKTVIDKDENDLIVTSACIGGILAKHILKEDTEKLLDNLLLLKGLFNNFYLEVQPHNHPLQITVNKKIAELSKEFSLPLVATNDVHYIDKDDCKLYDYIKLIRFNRTLDNLEETKSDFRELYFKTFNEMWTSFEVQNVLTEDEIVDAFLGVEKIIELCEEVVFDTSLKFGGFYENSYDTLEQKVIDGLYDKKLNHDKRYVDRISKELTVIRDKGFSEYFLIMSEIIEHCKENNLIAGIGRGSVGGSLIAYLLDITKLDPIRFNLIFERFINPFRCFIPETKVLLKDGVKDIKDIKVNDKVINKLNEIDLVKEVYKYNYKGKLLKVYFENDYIMCTPNHKLKVKNENGIEWKEVKTIDIKKDKLLGF